MYLKRGLFNLIINIIINIRHELGLDRLVSASCEGVKTVVQNFQYLRTF